MVPKAQFILEFKIELLSHLVNTVVIEYDVLVILPFGPSILKPQVLIVHQRNEQQHLPSYQ